MTQSRMEKRMIEITLSAVWKSQRYSKDQRLGGRVGEREEEVRDEASEHGRSEKG